MWLLDVNLPNGLLKLLQSLGISAETTVHRGWRNLGNGKLAEAAFRNGFTVILTRDRLFGESAGKALKSFPDLAAVILQIPQSKSPVFLQHFEEAWKTAPVEPMAGAIVEWP